MTTLLIATRNAHKVDEIRAILGEGLRYLTLKDFPAAPNVIEDADTFTGNAMKKAAGLARWLDEEKLSTFNLQPSTVSVLADDSGLEVDALGGKPGVHSARFAALDSSQQGNSTDVENNAKLLRLLTHVPLEQRTARFRCVLALTPVIAERTENASPVCHLDEFELQTTLFEGACEGRIDLAPRGQGGLWLRPAIPARWVCAIVCRIG